MEGFGISYPETMAPGCTVIVANHFDSVGDEAIADAGFLFEPTINDLSHTLRAVIDGQSPPIDPVERAQQYDWDAIADQTEHAYQVAIDGTW